MTSPDKKNILIACECSQVVCMSFRKRGFTAFSCDLELPYGGHPEWHILADVRQCLAPPIEVVTCDGERHFVDAWDLIIAHPPCTYLCRAQNGLYNRERFGDSATKKTSLRLYGLPKLTPTNIVDPPPKHYFTNSNPMGGWYFDTSKLPHKDRSRARSQTFKGIAEAMAEQWGAVYFRVRNISTNNKPNNRHRRRGPALHRMG